MEQNTVERAIKTETIQRRQLQQLSEVNNTKATSLIHGRTLKVSEVIL